MKTSTAVVIFVVIQCIAAVFAASKPCSSLALQGSKAKYDLSSLASKTYEVQSDDRQYTYEFSVCNALTMCAGNPGSAVCQEWGPRPADQASCGKWNPSNIQTIVPPDGNGIGLAFSDGDAGRTSNINIYCDPKASTPQRITVQSASSILQPYVISFYHKAGCPKKHGLSAGSIMLIVLFVTLSVYFIGGFLFLKFARGTEGFSESIPNHEFWFGLPGLIKDGVMFIVNKIRGGPSSYETVA